MQAMDWFNAVKEFRDVESKYLSQPGVFDLTLDEHRESVSNLIAFGEGLVLDIKKTGLVKDVSFSLEDVKATIESLRETFKGVHGPHNHPATNKAILDCLSAP